MQGLDVAGSLLSGASGSAFLSGDIASALLCAVGALLIFVSYVIITINLVVTLVESYLVVSAGYIFLGFGGSRWTAPYTERYIGLAVSIGIKLLVLYCVIAAGQSLGAGWNAEASGIGTSTTPAKTALDVIGGALIYMMCCWQIPKLFGAVIGGSPALTGGDLVMAGTAVAGGALAAASLGTGAVAGVAGAGQLELRVPARRLLELRLLPALPVQPARPSQALSRTLDPLPQPPAILRQERHL